MLSHLSDKTKSIIPADANLSFKFIINKTSKKIIMVNHFKFFFLSISILCGVLFISSCGDDDPDNAMCSDGVMNGTETGIDCGGDCPLCPVETTVAEDIENIKSSFNQMLSCVDDFKNSTTTDVMFRKFLKMSDGEVLNENWLEDLTDELDEVIDGEHIDDNSRIDLSYHSGTYQYVQTSKSWQKINNVTDEVVFRFPSDETQNTNNVELRIDKYEDQQVLIDGERLFLPTEIHVIMTVDSQKLMEFNLDNIEYASNSNFEIPVSLNANLFIAPMDIAMSVSRVSATEFSASIIANDGQSCNMGIEIDIELSDDDFENINEDSVEKAHVKINAGALTVQSIADLGSLIAIDDPTENQFNSLLDLDVLFNGIKIADLEYDEDNEVMNIYYKDLTVEDSFNYVESFLGDLEEMVKEFTGSW